jgi:hypothetical protein
MTNVGIVFDASAVAKVNSVSIAAMTLIRFTLHSNIAIPIDTRIRFAHVFAVDDTFTWINWLSYELFFSFTYAFILNALIYSTEMKIIVAMYA